MGARALIHTPHIGGSRPWKQNPPSPRRCASDSSCSSNYTRLISHKFQWRPLTKECCRSPFCSLHSHKTITCHYLWGLSAAVPLVPVSAVRRALMMDASFHSSALFSAVSHKIQLSELEKCPLLFSGSSWFKAGQRTLWLTNIRLWTPAPDHRRKQSQPWGLEPLPALLGTRCSTCHTSCSMWKPWSRN